MISEKISIIIPVKNSVAYIGDAIESVLQQTYPHKELIIIDGGSTDGTLNIIEKHSTNIAYFISENDKGIYDAINKGIAKASGACVYILGSDDKLHNEHVLEEIFTNEITSYDVIFGNVINTGGTHVMVRKKHICKLTFTVIWRNTQHQQGVF